MAAGTRSTGLGCRSQRDYRARAPREIRAGRSGASAGTRALLDRWSQSLTHACVPRGPLAIAPRGHQNSPHAEERVVEITCIKCLPTGLLNTRSIKKRKRTHHMTAESVPADMKSKCRIGGVSWQAWHVGVRCLPRRYPVGLTIPPWGLPSPERAPHIPFRWGGGVVRDGSGPSPPRSGALVVTVSISGRRRERKWCELVGTA